MWSLILIATKLVEAFLTLSTNQHHHSTKRTYSTGTYRHQHCINGLQLKSANTETFQPPHNFEDFHKCLGEMSLPVDSKRAIFQDIQNAGFTSSKELYAFCHDFEHRPEVLSTILQDDFGFGTLRSHQVRAALTRLIEMRNNKQGHESNSNQAHLSRVEDTGNGTIIRKGHYNETSPPNGTMRKDEEEKVKQPLFKSVIVNSKAKQRHTTILSNASAINNPGHNYGLPSNMKVLYPKISKELDEFMLFMTLPAASLQESPIRKATANVYLRHARLFLGWWLNYGLIQNGTSLSSDREDLLSVYTIFPTKEAGSAQPIVDFILWLRHYRDISDSYEANMLRGLTKFLKFRFSVESRADPAYGEKPFHDIPAVRELRKLHRDANRRQTHSPRSSDEDKKWLSWDEYLSVVKALREELEEEIHTFECKLDKTVMRSEKDDEEKIYSSDQRRIANKFQAYLILAFFSCIPDRQRTFRELEIGRSFLRDETAGCWTIKHGPDDYKTGKTYGDRPALLLATELTSAIDDFLKRWRDCLRPNGNHFFVQPRTGKAFTQDSVYSIVARSCYKYAGKKTNPHLLRDMIVTHVRDSDASEKELEALALYMGHSISMQRSSYDRRTMQQKVAPAVDLLRSINGQS